MKSLQSDNSRLGHCLHEWRTCLADKLLSPAVTSTNVPDRNLFRGLPTCLPTQFTCINATSLIDIFKFSCGHRKMVATVKGKLRWRGLLDRDSRKLKTIWHDREETWNGLRRQTEEFPILFNNHKEFTYSRQDLKHSEICWLVECCLLPSWGAPLEEGILRKQVCRRNFWIIFNRNWAVYLLQCL